MKEEVHGRHGQPARNVEVVLPCCNLDAAVTFYVETAGFRLDMIMPADAPSVAVVSRDNLILRLEYCEDSGSRSIPPRIRLRSEKAMPSDTGPDGVILEYVSTADGRIEIPKSDDWIISRAEDGTAWIPGRAGMFYRDLIPGRRQQSVIASHIRIVDAGPVADYVHYHRIGFQMIYCRRGSGRLVYEDKGLPFIMREGDCILQPPGIRHQVLEASAGFEVIELASPAQHETWRDHELKLPNTHSLSQRESDGQQFVHHVAETAPWVRSANGQATIRYTGMSTATQGMASARVLRIERSIAAKSDRFLFLFVLAGSCDVRVAGIGGARLQVDDASLLPSFADYELIAEGPCELLEVSLPANPHP